MMMDSDEDIAARRIGTAIGSWTIERLLGIGGMASVFLGRRADGVAAAIKVLHPYLGGIGELRKRFLREGPIGSALATLGPLCDGLPQVYESGVAEDGAAFMVMELLEGETVFDRMARHGVLSVEEVLRIAHKVLEVLVLAHQFGVVHRDLKPENIHVGKDGRIKVLDFGIARVVDSLPEGTVDLPEKTVTRSGVALGSGEYMAPEQAMGKNDEIDGRTDIFGVGAMMFRLLAGRYIHGDLDPTMLLITAATQRAPSLASIAPSIPAAVCAVVDLALAYHQAERYPNAATMRMDVYKLRGGNKPPYVVAIAEGRIKPGDPMPRN
jgi:eukaryotic-like serine/threonine-protein kinase